MSAFASIISNNLNHVVNRLTGVTIILMVPTLIAGIYGMNFENMPELAWQWGYPAVRGLMASVCGFLYFTFRKNHWL